MQKVARRKRTQKVTRLCFKCYNLLPRISVSKYQCRCSVRVCLLKIYFHLAVCKHCNTMSQSFVIPTHAILSWHN